MAKHENKEKTAKRITTEIAPGVRQLLEAHIAAFNETPDRTTPVMKYTDVVNQALDAYLPKLPVTAQS